MQSSAPSQAGTVSPALPPVELFRRYWPWLLPLAPLVYLLWGPVQWAWVTWSAPDSPQAYQPLVLPGALVLAWVRRREIQAAYEATKAGKKGGLWLTVLGVVLMVLAHGTQMASVSAVALIIIIAGVIYYMYGKVVLRALRTPLLFLFTMVPLPGFVVDQPTQVLQIASTKAAGHIMERLHIPTLVQGNTIITPKYTVEVAIACSGVGILLPLLVMTLWLLLMMEGSLGRKLFLLFVGFWIALAVNVLRITSMGLMGQFDADVANMLHDSNSWIFTALAFYLTYLAARALGITKLCSPSSS